MRGSRARGPASVGTGHVRTLVPDNLLEVDLFAIRSDQYYPLLRVGHWLAGASFRRSIVTSRWCQSGPRPRSTDTWYTLGHVLAVQTFLLSMTAFYTSRYKFTFCSSREGRFASL